jgi:hypothetical protein
VEEVDAAAGGVVVVAVVGVAEVSVELVDARVVVEEV